MQQPQPKAAIGFGQGKALKPQCPICQREGRVILSTPFDGANERGVDGQPVKGKVIGQCRGKIFGPDGQVVILPHIPNTVREGRID